MILNLTQHPSTPVQRLQGVEDLDPAGRARLGQLLTFEELPTVADMYDRCVDILSEFVLKVPEGTEIMLGAAPYFTSILQSEVERVGRRPVFAFSTRKSVEKANPDGSVTKTQVFEHLGFVRI